MSLKNKISDSNFWLKVLAYIFEALLDGVSSTAALSNASIKFNVSIDDIKTNIKF